jgi:chitin synthase
MVGAKYIDYLLEKTRVTGAEDGGRNFNIFYYLLAGATHEEKQQWQLGDPAHYHYLTISSVRAAFPEDASMLATLRDNLKDLGIGRRQQAQLFQLMAAILHLGNITFMDDLNNKSDEPCTVKNYPQLAVVADLLGVHPATLETTLTYKTQVIRKDTISVFLDAKAAAEQRDALARSLYAVAFSYVVEQVNNKLCKSESDWSNFIAILDTPGFGTNSVIGGVASGSGGANSGSVADVLGTNGFHRLLVNFANERLSDFVSNQLFELPREVLVAEGLSPPGQHQSHNAALALLEGPNGILPILDSEAAKGTKDSKATERLHNEHANTEAFVDPSQTTAAAAGKRLKHLFAIRHSLGTVVEYDTKGFADRNTDVLQSDFVTLIRGNPEQPGTSSPFLRNLFSDRMISTLTHSRDAGTVVAASSKSRHPSLKRSKRSASQQSADSSIDPAATVGHKVCFLKFFFFLFKYSVLHPAPIYR